MGLPIIRCLLFSLFIILNSGSSSETIKQVKKYETHELFPPSMTVHDTYPTSITVHDTYYPTSITVHDDTYPTNVPMGPTGGDIPTFNPTPFQTPTPTTTTPTAPTTTTPTTTTPTAPTTTTPTPMPPTTTTPNPPSTTPMGPITSTPTSPSMGGGAWCVANSGAPEKALQVALDYACGYGGADCSLIQPGGSCYNPDTFRDHASYAFNDYYQKSPTPTSCVFGGAAQLVYTDPSSGSCHYSSSKGSTSTTPPAPEAPTPPVDTSPPTMMSPPSPFISGTPLGGTGTGVGGGSDFGGEPIGSPNKAPSSYRESLIFIGSTSIFMYITLAVIH